MKTFKTYLTEISSTQRVGIQHFDKLTPTKFMELMKRFQDDFGGVLPKDKVQVTEKVDGSSIRFGVDENDRFFIESSHSGPLFNPGDFERYTISRGYEPNEISAIFESLLALLRKDKKLHEVLKKHNTGNGVKVIGEMFYNPMGKTVEKNKIRYVYINYDKSKLAELLTLVLFNTEGIDTQKQLFKDLKGISTKQIRYDNISVLKTSDIDLEFSVGSIADLLKDYDKTMAILKSRKKADKEEKEILKGMVQSAQADVRTKMLSYIKGGTYGDEFEGVVLDIAGVDGKLKLTTDVFRRRFASKRT